MSFLLYHFCRHHLGSCLLLLPLFTCSWTVSQTCARKAPNYGAIALSQWAGRLERVTADVTAVAGTRIQEGKEVEKLSGPRSSIWLANSCGVTGRSLWGSQDPEKGRTLTERRLRVAHQGGSYRDKRFAVSSNKQTLSCRGGGVCWDLIRARVATGR